MQVRRQTEEPREKHDMTPQPTPSSGRKTCRIFTNCRECPYCRICKNRRNRQHRDRKSRNAADPLSRTPSIYARAPVEVVRSREFHEQTRFICELSGPGGGPSRSSQTQRIRLPKIESRSSGIRCFDQGRTAWLTPQRFYGHSCRGGPGQPGLARKETL